MFIFDYRIHFCALIICQITVSRRSRRELALKSFLSEICQSRGNLESRNEVFSSVLSQVKVLAQVKAPGLGVRRGSLEQSLGWASLNKAAEPVWLSPPSPGASSRLFRSREGLVMAAAAVDREIWWR